MKQIATILTLLLFSLTPLLGSTPPWEFSEGNDKIFLFIPKDGIRLDEEVVEENVYVGVFFQEGNISKCAGFIQWKNDTTNLVVHGYSSSNTKPNSGTPLEFRVWDAENNCMIRQVHVYASNWDQSYTGNHDKIRIDSLVGRTKNRVLYSETISLGDNNYYTPEVFGSNDSLYFYTEQSDSLIIDAFTGEIDLEVSQPGNYTIVYQSETCLLYNEATISIVEKDQEYILSPQSNNQEYHQIYFKEVGVLHIVDVNGRVLKTLNGPSFWDGKSDHGSLLSNGEYYLLSEDGQKIITIIR